MVKNAIRKSHYRIDSMKMSSIIIFERIKKKNEKCPIETDEIFQTLQLLKNKIKVLFTRKQHIQTTAMSSKSEKNLNFEFPVVKFKAAIQSKFVFNLFALIYS